VLAKSLCLSVVCCAVRAVLGTRQGCGSNSHTTKLHTLGVAGPRGVQIWPYYNHSHVGSHRSSTIVFERNNPDEECREFTISSDSLRHSRHKPVASVRHHHRQCVHAGPEWYSASAVTDTAVPLCHISEHTIQESRRQEENVEYN